MPFLDELSAGIFNRLRELDDEQKARDTAAQRNTIAVLSDLYGRARPESQGVILDQLGKAIGVKGKMKSFWQAFSGMPDRSIEDQLGTQLRDLSARSMSAKQAGDIESKADISRMFGGGTGLSNMFNTEQSRARQSAIDAEKGLSGRLIFRDPRQEKLDEIEQRYAAQTQAALEKSAADKALANKYATERDAANRKGRINQIMTKYALDSQKDIDKIAWRYYIDDVNAGLAEWNEGIIQPPFEYQQRASKELQARAKLGDRKTEAQIRALDATGTGTKPMTPAQKAQQEQELTAEAQKLVTSVGTARTSRNTAVQRRDALKKQLEDYAKSKGLSFDANSGLFIGANDMDVAKAQLMLELQAGDRNLPKEYLTAKDEAEKAEAGLQTEFGKLKDKRYQDRVRIGQSADEEVTIIPQRGVKPTPATRGGKAGLMNRGEQLLRIPPDSVQIGEEVPFKDGRTYKVIRKGKDHVIVKFIN